MRRFFASLRMTGGRALQPFGEKACHSERSEESGLPDAEILRFTQNDRGESSPARSQVGLSPNACHCCAGVVLIRFQIVQWSQYQVFGYLAPSSSLSALATPHWG